MLCKSDKPSIIFFVNINYVHTHESFDISVYCAVNAILIAPADMPTFCFQAPNLNTARLTK